MEDGLVRTHSHAAQLLLTCLNPCCNGRWSRTSWHCQEVVLSKRGLNPCCNGRWSRTRIGRVGRTQIDRLNPCCNGRWSRTSSLTWNVLLEWVLILVVMEDGLVLVKVSVLLLIKVVLILVVMEDGLVLYVQVRDTLVH